MKLTEKKRESIIKAAIEEFREHGFLGAKTTRIAKKAHVSSRTLYNHFESKEVLFQAISKIMIERKSTVATVPFDPARDLETQFIETLERYVEAVTEPETLALTRMVYAELLRDLERSRVFFTELATYDDPITQLISGAMKAGALRKANPEYAAKQLIGLIRSFFYMPEFMLGQKLETDGVMQDCVKMFLSHYEPDNQHQKSESS